MFTEEKTIDKKTSISDFDSKRSLGFMTTSSLSHASLARRGSKIENKYVEVLFNVGILND